MKPRHLGESPSHALVMMGGFRFPSDNMKTSGKGIVSSRGRCAQEASRNHLCHPLNSSPFLCTCTFLPYFSFSFLVLFSPFILPTFLSYFSVSFTVYFRFISSLFCLFVFLGFSLRLILYIFVFFFLQVVVTLLECFFLIIFSFFLIFCSTFSFVCFSFSSSFSASAFL